jgi:hypothetical protein
MSHDKSVAKAREGATVSEETEDTGWQELLDYDPDDAGFIVVDSYADVPTEIDPNEAKNYVLRFAADHDITEHSEEVRRSVTFEEGPHLDDPINAAVNIVQWVQAGITSDSPGITDDMRRLLTESPPKLDEDQAQEVRSILAGKRG